MNQDKHLFQFTGRQIADACTAEVAYRKERIAYWQSQQDEVLDKVKHMDTSATIEVKEWEHSSGREIQIIAVLTEIQDMNAVLSRASTKLNEHRKAVIEFELKGAAYATQPSRAYELDPSDVAYFKLNGATRSD